MTDINPEAPIAPEGDAPPVEPPAPDPWQAWQQAGVDPSNQDALKAYQIGQSIYDVNTRQAALEDIIRQDPQLRAHLERSFTRQQPPPAVQPGYQQPDPGYQDPFDTPDDYAVPQPGQAGYVTPEMMEAQLQDLRVEGWLMNQLNQQQGLSDQQKAEVYNRAWQRYQAGELTTQTVHTVVGDTLNEIRSMWGATPPQQPGNPDLAAQLAAQQQGAPAGGVDTGVTPGGIQEPTSVRGAADAARQLLAAQQRGLG